MSNNDQRNFANKIFYWTCVLFARWWNISKYLFFLFFFLFDVNVLNLIILKLKIFYKSLTIFKYFLFLVFLCSVIFKASYVSLAKTNQISKHLTLHASNLSCQLLLNVMSKPLDQICLILSHFCFKWNTTHMVKSVKFSYLFPILHVSHEILNRSRKYGRPMIVQLFYLLLNIYFNSFMTCNHTIEGKHLKYSNVFCVNPIFGGLHWL